MSELAEEIASTTTGLGKLIHKIFCFFPRNNFGCAFSKTLLLTANYLPHCMLGLHGNSISKLIYPYLVHADIG
jgi:hypothetical protein